MSARPYMFEEADIIFRGRIYLLRLPFLALRRPNG